MTPALQNLIKLLARMAVDEYLDGLNNHTTTKNGPNSNQASNGDNDEEYDTQCKEYEEENQT